MCNAFINASPISSPASGSRLPGLQRGFSLVELMIGLAIVGAALMFGIPSFGSWIQNSQIRTAADAIQDAMRLARAEAIGRNAQVQFSLTDVVAGNAGASWSVGCAAGSLSCTDAVIQSKSAAEGSKNVTVTAATPTVTFNGMGRVTPPAAADVVIQLQNPNGGTCVASGGNMRCLNVVVKPSGQARKCDPALVAPDPNAC